MRLSRFAASIVAAALAFSVLGLVDHAYGQDTGVASATRLSVTRDEDARIFNVSRAASPALRMTFLSPTAFRVHVFTDEAAVAQLHDYMRVKSDASYPPVAVKAEQERDAVTFSTAAITIHVAADDRAISIAVRTPDGNLIDNWTIDPGARTMQIDLRADEHIYGFGDKRAALDQRGQSIEMANRDAYGSETNESYKSIPFYMSSAGYGLFFHNFRPSTFDVGVGNDKIKLKATGGPMDFYVFTGDLKRVLTQYTELTGRPAMLPRWAFGYHQGKASYDNDEAFEVARKMRQCKLPMDVIFYDDWIEEATTKRFISSLWSKYHVRLTMGFGMPMFGTWEGTDDSLFLKEITARNFVMVDRQNKPVIGPDWRVDETGQNSSVSYLDYFSPQAVNYLFAAKWEKALKNGLLLGMVDFGEMDNFSDATDKFWPSLGMSVVETRNLFGLAYPMSVVDGVVQRTGGRSTGMVRPGFAGTQRLGWSTTGDSYPSYQNFRAHTRGMLNLTLSGFSNVGQDIGGWDHKGPDIIYGRWFAAGTLNPFMWSHGQNDHEPYAHGPVVEKAAREWLNLRYRLVPYLYSLHEETHRTGVPMLRSFPLQEQADPAARRIDDQYFIGDNLLVAPLFDDGGNREVYLPKGLWYDFFGEQPPEQGGRSVKRTSVPLDRLPVYVREGGIVPLGPVMQYTSEKPVDPLSIHVFGFAADDAADTRTSAASLYDDDGLSADYQNGEFQRTNMRYEQARDAVKFSVAMVSGDDTFVTDPRNYQIRFYGLGSPGNILLDGKPVPHAGKKSSPASASWSANQTTGEISIFVPKSIGRAFTVEFSTRRG